MFAVSRLLCLVAGWSLVFISPVCLAAPAGAADSSAVTTVLTATTRGSVPKRLPPRAVLAQDDYAKQAAELRAAYSRPAAEWPAPTIDPGVEYRELGLLPTVTFPDANPYTKEKEALGKALFFDPRLSGSGQIACASCHDPDLAWADGRTTSFGHGRTPLKRNAPSVQYAAFARTLFWDGRAKDLEDQFFGPVINPDEMHGEVIAVQKRLAAIPEYREMFKAAFGSDGVSIDAAAKAVGTFERSVAKLAGRSDFDKFLKGDDKKLGDAAVRGLHVFRTTGRCANCHNGPTLSDDQFHDLGLSYYGREYEDLGRYTVTKKAADVGRFRTPSLRNVARTRPYMHTGFFDLDGVIAAYNAGMATLVPRDEKQRNDPLFPKKDPLLQSLGLNKQDREDLRAFLESLSEPPLRMRAPKLPGDPVLAAPATAVAKPAANSPKPDDVLIGIE